MNERLLMPEVFHGVAGEETAFYFSNVYAVLDPGQYAFDFDCAKGSCYEERWFFSPAKEDAGTLEAELQIHDNDGVVDSGKCTVVIHDPARSAGKKIRLLMIGDSLTDQTHYPAHIHTLCRRYGIDLEMLGTNVPEKLRNVPGQLIRYPEAELLPGVRHEGYGGWSAGTFLTRKEAVKGDKCRHWLCPSPFLNGEGEFDFKEYLDKNCSGTAPDVIFIGLGSNDLNFLNDENYGEKKTLYLKNMHTLYTKLRKDAPEAVFGIVLSPYGAASQSAWGNNCGSRNFRWPRRRLMASAYRELEKLFSAEEKCVMLPLYHSIDPIYGYPREESPAFAGSDITVTCQCNALHPTPAGYRQMGTAAFGALLDIIEKHF